MRGSTLWFSVVPVAAVLIAFSCATVDVEDLVEGTLDGREDAAKAFALIDKARRNPFPAEEYYIGRAVAAAILTRYPATDDPGRTGYLNTLGQALAKFSALPETFRGYRFAVLDTDGINAFAAPGGFIFLTRGLLAGQRNEEQMAAVVAHEIAHVSLRHGTGAIRQASWTKALTVIGLAAGQMATDSEVMDDLAESFDDVIDDIVQGLVVNGYSRQQEYAADREALNILHRAGYDPLGLAESLRTLREKSAYAERKGFFETHPPAGDRLGEVERYIKDNRLEGIADRVRTARFSRYAL